MMRGWWALALVGLLLVEAPRVGWAQGEESDWDVQETPAVCATVAMLLADPDGAAALAYSYVPPSPLPSVLNRNSSLSHAEAVQVTHRVAVLLLVRPEMFTPDRPYELLHS